MTLTQLEYFCAVCRYHSISRAAEELFVSQPTVSMAIRDLENELHVKLLNHQRNRISITSEGNLFYQKADDLLQQSRELYSEFSSISSTTRPLKIAIPPLISTVLFPRIIDAFHEKYDTPVELYEYGSVRARKLLDSELLDLAFVNMDFSSLDQYNAHEIMENHVVYCISRSHRYADQEKLTMDMLEGERIILLNTDSVLNRQILEKYNAARIKPNVYMYSSQLYTTLNTVRGGDCGAFLYSSIAVNPRDFVQLPLEPLAHSHFGIIWKKGTFISQRTEQFIKFVQHYTLPV